MSPHHNRDEFGAKVRTALARRAGYVCAICGASTEAPSAESAISVSSIGVAAHITAAAPKGPRYDPTLTPVERARIDNAIWLCRNHGTAVDNDVSTFTALQLREIKQQHETKVKESQGVPRMALNTSPPAFGVYDGKAMTPREFAFVFARNLEPVYAQFIAPILEDCGLNENSELGVLMCNSPSSDRGPGPEWTVFVAPKWLRWYLAGQGDGFKAADTVAAEHIYGRIPGWPDSFLEFLQAMVDTNTTFRWDRHPDGYLLLSQVVPK
jgi:hypothetical protein